MRKQVSGKAPSASAIARALGVVLLTCITLAGCTRGRSAELGAAAAIRGSVAFLEGSVTIDGKPAETGMELGAVARVETGPSSSCEIIFDGRNVIKVMQNTFAEIDFGKARKEITLKRGGVAAVLKKLDAIAGEDSFRVNGPAAIAGVRGTVLCVWADDASTYVCACNGKVHTLDSKGSNEQELQAAHHAARLYTLKDGSISVEEAGLLHHSDAGVEALAAKIGYAVDWTKVD